MGLLSLPAEIIQNICQNLSIEDVISLSNSCDQLAKCINQKAFWLRRISNGFKDKKYSCIPGNLSTIVYFEILFYSDKQVDWREVCIAHERITSWFHDSTDAVVNKLSHHYTYMSIDALKILRVNLTSY